MLGLCLFPKGKVHGIALLALSVEVVAAGVEYIVEITARKDSIVVSLVIFCHIEIYRALALVGKAIVENLLNEFYLLNDVSDACGSMLGGNTFKASITL